MLWRASHSLVFRGVFVRWRDLLVFARMVHHLSAGDAFASLWPVFIGSWSVW